MNSKKLKYSKEFSSDFMDTAKERVRLYFKENNLTRYGNTKMYVKTAAMVSIYLVPYFLLLSGLVVNTWAIFSLWIVMGIGMAGVGLSVMHDANHNSYSKNKTVNKYMGLIINLVGGNALNWKIQHNVLHHTYTNIDGWDEDIKTVNILRFSPHQPRFSIHRFQHLYAWFFYGLMTVMWATTKDFAQFKRYKERGLLSQFDKGGMGVMLTKVVLSKVLYYIVFLFIPMALLPIHWALTIAFFFSMHFVAGLILGMVFQPAHVMPTSDFPQPNKDGIIQNNWAMHQMYTTTNFAPKSKLLSWYVGGLNYQIEHHLFPNICHVHYPNIAKIVEQTAKEFNLPYNSERTFRSALLSHAKMLRCLGTSDDLGKCNNLRLD